MHKDIILSTLRKFRPLFSYVFDCPDKILREIAAILPSKQMVFPCDIIDLRIFLSKERIFFTNPIPIFSLRFAEKYLKEYSVFLMLDAQKIEVDNYKYGGIQLNLTDSIDISKLLLKIIVNEPVSIGSFDTVKKIVEELDIGVECLVSNSIPGISFPSPKLSITTKKKEYKVSQIITNSELSLTSKEKNIFEFLQQVKKDHNLNIQMRVAGGWVRDKLLGKKSDDIDIAIDMPGYNFAKLVADDAVKYNISNDSKAYKVSLEKSADPTTIEPSDNLMVGATSLFGQKIEFIPMRTEYYPDKNSRQPSIKMTRDPREDVKRRDLTINALYYNIDTGKVDDFVEGKKDLGLDNSGEIILRTPDEPYKTFHEDPLRLLRVLRFHSRYPNSIIEPSIIKAMKEETIQESYTKKVATERAGPELMKMLAGEDPVDSLRLLFDTGLYKTVFKVPYMENINEKGIHMDQQTPYHKYNLLNHTLEVVKNLNKIMKDNGESDYMRGLMNVSALFHDFGKMQKGIQQLHPKNPGQMQYIGHEKASSKMADQILKSIGVGKDDRDIVNQVISSHMRHLDADKWGPKGKGKFLRDTRMHGKDKEHKDLWKYIFYHAKADSMSSQPDNFDVQKNQKVFDDFSNFVESPHGAFRGTVINGTDIISIFGTTLSPQTGYIKEVLDKVKELQDTGNIDMTFVTLPEGDNKALALEKSKKQAIEAVKQIAPIIIEKYKEITMGQNWFKKVKKSQIVLPMAFPVKEDDPEIVKGPNEAHPQYYIGMIVRDRRKGVANPQEYGKVEDIKDNKIKIVWNPNDKDKKRERIFDVIEDTAALSLIVAEV